MTVALPNERPSGHEVRGVLELFVPKQRAGLTPEQVARRRAHQRFALGHKRLLEPPRHENERLMIYRLDFVRKPELSLVGYKRIGKQPGIGAWRDVTCLFLKLLERRGASESPESNEPSLLGAGAVHLELFDFLSKQVPSVRATGTDDAARAMWATGQFSRYFFGTLQRIYLPELAALGKALFRFESSAARREYW